MLILQIMSNLDEILREDGGIHVQMLVWYY